MRQSPPRIAVLGTCHVEGIAAALLHIIDHAEVHTFGAAAIRSRGNTDEIAKLLHEYDVVFTHDLGEDFGALSTSALRDTCNALLRLPNFLFTGFHPDCIYLAADGKHYPSHCGVYHSAIAASAFAAGLCEADTEALFNRFVFTRLGFLGEFQQSKDYMVGLAARCGMDIRSEWDHWMEAGCFMHTTNHPKARVLASIANLAAINAGLVPNGNPTPSVEYDPLGMNCHWPVYPGVAEALGLKGNFLYKRPVLSDFVTGQTPYCTLTEFILASFELYRSFPASAFEAPALAHVRSSLAALI